MPPVRPSEWRRRKTEQEAIEGRQHESGKRFTRWNYWSRGWFSVGGRRGRCRAAFSFEVSLLLLLLDFKALKLQNGRNTVDLQNLSSSGRSLAAPSRTDQDWAENYRRYLSCLCFGNQRVSPPQPPPPLNTCLVWVQPADTAGVTPRGLGGWAGVDERIGSRNFWKSEAWSCTSEGHVWFAVLPCRFF